MEKKNKLHEKMLFLRYAFDGTDNGELFEYIWDNYGKRISFFISNIIHVQQSVRSDIFQDVMIKIFNNLEHYNPLYSFETWIYTITRNHCINYLKTKKETESFEALEDRIFHDNNPEKIFIQNQVLEAIDKSIESLEHDDRQIVYLWLYERLKYREISSVLDMNLNTVKSRIRKIKQRMSNELGYLK